MIWPIKKCGLGNKCRTFPWIALPTASDHAIRSIVQTNLFKDFNKHR